MPIQTQDPTLLLVQNLVKVQTLVGDGEQADEAFFGAQGQFSRCLKKSTKELTHRGTDKNALINLNRSAS